MNNKVQKSIRIDKNLNVKIREVCRELDISQSAYIKLCILKDLNERK